MLGDAGIAHPPEPVGFFQVEEEVVLTQAFRPAPAKILDLGRPIAAVRELDVLPLFLDC